jgi:hypothetical protein
MERVLMFEFDGSNNIWFNIRNDTLHCKDQNLFIGKNIDFKDFGITLFEWLNHHHYWDIQEMYKDIRKYPSHDIIYDWMIYMFLKEEEYIGTCRIRIEKDKIMCLSLNTEANIPNSLNMDELELIIKKLKAVKL